MYRMILAVLLALGLVTPVLAQTADDVTPLQAYPPSRSGCMYTIAAMLKQAAAKSGNKGVWKGTNKTQERFLTRSLPYWSDLAKIPEVIAFTGTADDAKAFITEKKLSLKVPDVGDVSLGYFNIKGEWQVPGSYDIEYIDDTPYSAANIIEGVKFYKIAGQEPIVELSAKSGDKVYLYMIAPDQYQQPLLPLAMDTMERMVPYQNDELKGVVFPEVQLDQQSELDWIGGMRYFETADTLLPSVKLGYGGQQNKFLLTAKGFEAQSVSVVAISKGIKKVHPLHIDKPFLVWVSRRGCSAPLFVALSSKNSWVKRPQ